MTRFQNQCIKQLLQDIRFSPVKQKLKQIQAAEDLLAHIDIEKQYPYEFICHKITDFRPKLEQTTQIIDGKSLQHDLLIFISKLSGTIDIPEQYVKEKLYTIKSLAEELNVSTKTINRWRDRGLVARSFIFEDGKRRLGVLQSSLDKFISANPSLFENAGKFKLLTENEKAKIVELAIEYARTTELSRKQIIIKIADQLQRAQETVRYTLVNYEKENPDKQVFQKPSGVISPSEGQKIFKLFTQGVKIEELMAKFNRSRSSIYRIVNQQRARKIMRYKIDFIPSEEFKAPARRSEILAERIHLPSVGLAGVSRDIDSLPQYLQSIKAIPLLTRDQELALFRKYNCLKYLAWQCREKIQPAKPSSKLLKQVENYYIHAERVKNRLIESNLRLVVSIATRHMNHGLSLSDLISEGNFTLMRAIEKFNYSKGFRFSTYASLAIAKDYAKKLPAEAARLDKAGSKDLSAELVQDVRSASLKDVVAIEKANKSLETIIQDNLNEREQYIVRNHYGLDGSLIRKKAKSMNEIGKELGISRERVRQIELEALQKLRHSLSEEEFELFMG